MYKVVSAVRNGKGMAVLTPLLSDKSEDEMNTLVERRHILQYAIESGASLEVIGALITAGARVNEPGLYGFAALTWAAMLGEEDDKDYKIALMNTLLAAGANVNNVGNFGQTALGMAAYRGGKAAVALLLEHDAGITEEELEKLPGEARDIIKAELMKKKENQEGGRRRTRAKRGKAHRSRKTRHRQRR